MSFSILGQVLKESNIQQTEDQQNKQNKQNQSRQVLCFECETLSKQQSIRDQSISAVEYQKRINKKQQTLNNQVQSTSRKNAKKTNLDKLVNEMTNTQLPKQKKNYQVDLTKYNTKQKKAKADTNLSIEDLQTQFEFMSHLMIPQAVQDSRQGHSILNVTQRHQSQVMKEIIENAPQKITDQQRNLDLTEFLQQQRINSRQQYVYGDQQQAYQLLQTSFQDNQQNQEEQVQINNKDDFQLSQQGMVQQENTRQSLLNSKYQNDKVIQYCKNKRVDKSQNQRDPLRKSILKQIDISTPKQYHITSNADLKYSKVQIQQNQEQTQNMQTVQQLPQQQVEIQPEQLQSEQKQEEIQQNENMDITVVQSKLNELKMSKIYESQVYDFTKSQVEKQDKQEQQQKVEQQMKEKEEYIKQQEQKKKEQQQKEEQYQREVQQLRAQVQKQAQELVAKMQQRIKDDQQFDDQEDEQHVSGKFTPIQKTLRVMEEIKESLFGDKTDEQIQQQETVDTIKKNSELLDRFIDLYSKLYKKIEFKTQIEQKLNQTINHFSAEVQILAIKVVDQQTKKANAMTQTQQFEQEQQTQTEQQSQPQQQVKPKPQLKLNKIGLDRQMFLQLQMLAKTKQQPPSKQTVVIEQQLDKKEESYDDLMLSSLQNKQEDTLKYFLNDGVIYIYKDGQEFKCNYDQNNIKRLENNKVQLHCHDCLDKSYDIIIDDNKELFQNM